MWHRKALAIISIGLTKLACRNKKKEKNMSFFPKHYTRFYVFVNPVFLVKTMACARGDPLGKMHQDFVGEGGRALGGRGGKGVWWWIS